MNLRFGGGVSGTVLNPAVALIILLTGVLMCCRSQKKAIVPFLLTSFLVPSDQVLVLGGLHFPLLRILIAFGMIRIFMVLGLAKGKALAGGLNSIDKSLILLSLTSAVAGVLLFQNTQIITSELGELYTAFGAYFFLRCFIRDHEDVVRAIRVLALIAAVVGGVMIFERLMNGWNPYALLGGARAQAYAADMARDGRIRAVGSFAQPIVAGTFGAVVVPLFIGIWLTEKRYRRTAVMGIVGAMAMVFTCNSSTPLVGVQAGLLGLCLWPMRNMMRAIRWAIALTLVSLHMFMKAPVWHLIARVDLSGGSASYHRYLLIDSCIRHFGDWWLIGTNSNADWGWHMFDTANQYVDYAIRGGVLGLTCFIAIMVYGFKYLGTARKVATDKRQALFFWALGSALLAHVMSFLGTAYWDQSIVGWYALLAFIGAIAVPQNVQAGIQQLGEAAVPEFATAGAQPSYANGCSPATKWNS